MLEFVEFKKKVQEQFDSMSNLKLYVTDVSKDDIWSTYLDSFDPEHNKILKERREYDCQHCKQFIRACGNVVALKANKLISIWDIEIGHQYQVVADSLSELVKSAQVRDVFFKSEQNMGVDNNKQLLDNGNVVTWNHFYYKLPSKFVKNGTLSSDQAKERSNKQVWQRSFEELTLESAETVLELIEQKSLYRGEEHKSFVETFIKFKREFDKLSEEDRDNYCWTKSESIGIRNTVIGTLLVDISDGKELDVAVTAFESKVAPTNYKRPTAIVTQSMIKSAQKKVQELGLEDSLARRYATVEDISVNDILFVDRATKKAMNVFDEMVQETPSNVKKFDKIEEVDIETFVNDLLPKAESVEVLFENNQANNLVSLIAPQNKNSKNMFKWGNNFSWTYNGEVADSIKERVKNAGGNVTGVLRCSLSWFNYDDLDIHIIEPNGNHIFYSQPKNTYTSGVLDVDMNATGGNSRNAVENITWTNKSRMQEGLYKLYINNYALRENIDVGFDVEIEYAGKIHTFHYDRKVVGNVTVAEFEFSRKKGVTFKNSLPPSQSSKEFWGINTNNFHKVSTVMYSPNYWNGEKTGNKHYFFMLENCKSDKAAKGFFNEFLKDDFREHRKVFEILGSKMKAEYSDNQLSGLGFSSTKRSQLVCKLTGNFARTIKINF